MGSTRVFCLKMQHAKERALRYLDYVVDELRHRGSVVFEAYPGFGKTFLGLMTIQRVGRGTYVTRTISEIKTVLEIGAKLGVEVSPLYGRMQLCTRIENAKSVEEFSALCKAMRVVGTCSEPISRELIEIVTRLRDPDELKKVARERGICIYKAHLVASLRNRCVVTTYEFVSMHSELFNDLNRDVVVYDECHALVDMAERFVVKVDRWNILGIATSVKDAYPKLCYALRSVAKRSSSALDLLHSLEKLIESGIEGVEIIEPLVDCFRKNLYYYDKEEDAVYLVRKPEIELGKLRLFMTAFVPPFIVSGKSFIRVEDPPIKIPTYIDRSITTRYQERGEDFIYRVFEVAVNHIDKECANLVVVPNKVIAEELSRMLMSKGFRVAPPDNIDRVGAGTVVIDVAGGRATEGVTPSKELKKVIVVGMPYPPPNPVLNALSKVYGFHNVYTYIALLRTVQAIGRLMRWGGRAVLADRRFAHFIEKFPPWIEIET